MASRLADLAASQERFALAVSGSTDGLWDWNVLTDEVYYSPRWKAMLGLDDTAVGCGVNEWTSRIHSADRQRVLAELEAHRVGETPHFKSEYRIENAAGEYRWMMCRGLVVTDEDGKAYRMTGSHTDITERKKAEEKLVFNALHDALMLARPLRENRDLCLVLPSGRPLHTVTCHIRRLRVVQPAQDQNFPCSLFRSWLNGPESVLGTKPLKQEEMPLLQTVVSSGIII